MVRRVLTYDDLRYGDKATETAINRSPLCAHTRILPTLQYAFGREHTPSHGIDTSKDVQVSLSFALYELSSSDLDSSLQKTSFISSRAEPVLYVFALPFEHYYIDFEKDAGLFGVTSRPKKQGATFLYDGWGKRNNDAVRWLRAAFYPKELHNFTEVKDLKSYFPAPEEDLFGKIIFTLRDHLKLSTKLKSYLV